MWWNISPGTRAEFEDWHSHEHMPERLAIPGFRRGTRWIAISGAREALTYPGERALIERLLSKMACGR